jgi:hypothetical protein
MTNRFVTASGGSPGNPVSGNFAQPASKGGSHANTAAGGSPLGRSTSGLLLVRLYKEPPQPEDQPIRIGT